MWGFFLLLRHLACKLAPQSYAARISSARRELSAKRWLASFILLTLTFTSPHTAIAQPTQSACDVANQPSWQASMRHALPVGNCLAQLHDKNGNLEIAEVLAQAHAFTPNPSQNSTQNSPLSTTNSLLDFGSVSAVYWVRLRLANGTENALPALLELDYPDIAEVDFYQPKAAAKDGFEVVKTGNSRPFASRAFPHRHFVFPISQAAHSEQIYYLRIKTHGSLAFPIGLWHPDAFPMHERIEDAMQYWFFGVVLALLVFNLLLLVILRDTVYLWYVSFTLSLVLCIASANGMAGQFLWPNSVAWNPVSPFVLASTTSILLILFMRRMLDTASLLPHLDVFMKAASLGHALLIPVLLFVVESPLPLSTFAHVASLLLAWLQGVACVRLQQRDAYFFITSLTLVVLAMLYAILPQLMPLHTYFSSLLAIEISSAFHLLILAFILIDRYNAMQQERVQAQQSAYDTRAALVTFLQTCEREREETVRSRTQSLSASNDALINTNEQLLSTYQAANDSRQQAERAQQQATSALQELRSAQAQMIQAEKMAALGQLIAGVAHEINTPIGAMKSSGKNIADALYHTLHELPQLLKTLDRPTLAIFLHLIEHAHQSSALLSTREERALIREATRSLEAAEIGDARRKADVMVQMRAHGNLIHYLPLLTHPQSEQILDTARNLATIINSIDNINVAVERVAKIVFALKSFSHEGHDEVWSEAQLVDGIESVLLIYQNQIKQGIQLHREFQTIAPLTCLFDELNQVWTNLIHNALQAMDNKGSLTIKIERIADEAVVSIHDTGCGIAEEVQGKIFDTFFTTKAIGEGSGLGLDIVRKIVEKHRGRITFSSQQHVGTTFSVFLPYSANLAQDDGGVV